MTCSCSCHTDHDPDDADFPCLECGGTAGQPRHRPKLYLLGPMTGIADFNYPAFDAAAADLRGRGYDIVCPTETDAAHDWKPGEHDPAALPLDEYRRPLRWALRAALADDIEGGVALPGWERSNGARIEALVLMALKLPVLRYPDLAEFTAIPSTINPQEAP